MLLATLATGWSRGSVQMTLLPQASSTISVFEEPSLMCENGIPSDLAKSVSVPVGTRYDVRNLPLSSKEVGRLGHA